MSLVASRNVLIPAGPDAVWSVLADGYSYTDWVVGTREIRYVDPGWPQPGSALHFTAGWGPFTIADKTTSRICEPRRRLELEAHALPYGSVRISIELLPWGEECVAIIDEHPLRGPSALLENPIVEFVLTIRNRRMLRKLAQTVKRRRTLNR
ncbi:MAG TPA: SRPBCC family protein [Acidimicrobiales bacterium]|nr:SRPBCC family protein [Acidimicrobiales bacterium]